MSPGIKPELGPKGWKCGAYRLSLSRIPGKAEMRAKIYQGLEIDPCQIFEVKVVSEAMARLVELSKTALATGQ